MLACQQRVLQNTFMVDLVCQPFERGYHVINPMAKYLSPSRCGMVVLLRFQKRMHMLYGFSKIQSVQRLAEFASILSNWRAENKSAGQR